MSKTKKLYRDTDNKMIFGVCSGLADYFEVDVALMRIIWVFLFFAAGTGGLAYIVIAIILEPKDVVISRIQKDKEKERKDSGDPFADYSDDPFKR